MGIFNLCILKNLFYSSFFFIYNPARYFLLQLIDATRYLHAHAIIHRDLKLGNLFLTNDMEIRVGDFGLATQLTHPGERKRTICGTPNYIAPEILDGPDGHSFEVDVWALGVILFTMLVGKPPFETSNVKETYERIRANSYKFPSDLQISDEARDLISLTLVPIPDNRPKLAAMARHPWFTGPQAVIPRRIPRSALKSVPTFTRADFIPGIEAVNAMLERPIGGLLEKGRASRSITSETHGAVAAKVIDVENIPVGKGADKGGSISAPTVSGNTHPTLRPLPLQTAWSSNPQENIGGLSHRGNFSSNFATSSVPTGSTKPQIYCDFDDKMEQDSACTNGNTNSVNTNLVSNGGPLTSASTTTDNNATGWNSSRGASSTMNRAFIPNSSASNYTDSVASVPVALSALPSSVVQMQHAPGQRVSSRDIVSSTTTGFPITSTKSGVTTSAPPLLFSPPSSAARVHNVKVSNSAEVTTGVHVSVPTSGTLLVLDDTLVSFSNYLAQADARGDRDLVTIEDYSPNNAQSSSSTSQPMALDDDDENIDMVRRPSGYSTSPMDIAKRAAFRLIHPISLANTYDSYKNDTFSIDNNNNYLWVTEWLDFSSKYGVGYLLSNGVVGVYFNDSTKAVLSPDGNTFEYIERHNHGRAPPTTSIAGCSVAKILKGPEGIYRIRATLNSFPAELSKKLTLLKYFSSTLQETYKKRLSFSQQMLAAHGFQGYKADVFFTVPPNLPSLVSLDGELFAADAASESLSTGGSAVNGGANIYVSYDEFRSREAGLANVKYLPSTGLMEEDSRSTSSVASINAFEPAPELGASDKPMHFVKKYVRSRRCMMFRLSTRALHVAFYDGTSLLLCCEARTAVYTDRGANRFAFNVLELLGARSSLASRIGAPSVDDVDCWYGNVLPAMDGSEEPWLRTCLAALRRLRYTKECINGWISQNNGNNPSSATTTR
jgi:serine/threonine protein kinase